jgi:hypothetical protein
MQQEDSGRGVIVVMEVLGSSSVALRTETQSRRDPSSRRELATKAATCCHFRSIYLPTTAQLAPTRWAPLLPPFLQVLTGHDLTADSGGAGLFSVVSADPVSSP